MPKHFSARFVVLSFFVGYLGSLTTLELLMRRTSMRGLYNWYGSPFQIYDLIVDDFIGAFLLVLRSLWVA